MLKKWLVLSEINCKFDNGLEEYKINSKKFNELPNCRDYIMINNIYVQ